MLSIAVCDDDSWYCLSELAWIYSYGFFRYSLGVTPYLRRNIRLK